LRVELVAGWAFPVVERYTQDVPVVVELPSVPDPARCCELLDGLPYRLLLDSAARGTRLGRYSFLMADPIAVVRSKGTRTEYVAVASDTVRPIGADVLTEIRALLAAHVAEPVAGLPPFQGGAAGYLAYDWGRTLERIPACRYDDLALPDVVLGIYDWVVAWDHDEARAWLISTGLPEVSADARGWRAELRAADVRARLDGLDSGRLPTDRSSNVGTTGDRSFLASSETDAADRTAAPSYAVVGGWWDPRLGVRSAFTHDGYLDAVRRVRDYILAGDIFQVNLSQRFEALLDEQPWELYLRMRQRNAAPFAAYFDTPHAEVLSASPERFLRVDVEGRVETRPIKGTRPRGIGPEHDGALGRALTESAKDRAENLMIVDLMRNDLSRVCSPGTVRVPELFALERYATVHHLVSTVIGRLAPGHDALDLLGASFPGGSITGAPKVRAMEIIAELEPSQRSVYCGSIGYWSVTGALDTNIAIRTVIAPRGRGQVYFNAGGGIVADSEPEQEYRETLDKARGMIDSLPRNAAEAFR
jgi:para-aminobenzoate synthetase component 1